MQTQNASPTQWKTRWLVSRKAYCAVKRRDTPWRGEALPEFSELWTERAAIAASLIKPGSRILDLGCGQGLIRQFLPADCIWHGYDLRPLQPEIDFVDLDKGVFPDGRFDCIVMLGVLGWLANPRAVLERALSSAPLLIASDRQRRWRWRRPLRMPRSEELGRIIAGTRWQIDRKTKWCSDSQCAYYVCRLCPV